LEAEAHAMRKTAWVVDAMVGVSWLPWGNLSLDT
jgi:hypothetical protein